MKRTLHFTIAAAFAFIAGAAVLAQGTGPELQYDVQVEPLKLPDTLNFGEVAGIATSSKGDVYVYTRTGHPTISLGTARPFAHGGSRLFHFDKSGKYVGEIGQGVYGFLFAEKVKVDPQDNIWVVDQMANMVMEFDPQGREVLLLGRKAEAENVPPRGAGPAPAAAGRGAEAGARGAAPQAPAAEGGGGRGRGGPPGAGGQQDVFNRVTDVAWDAAGNIYVADGLGNSRIAKFDKDGKFIRSWGQTGNTNGQFRQPRSIAIDAQGLVYVADTGNKRIQVFDGDGNFKREINNIGSPRAICITPGAQQVLYATNSNQPEDIDMDGEIYKLDLNGKVLGRFGKAGHLPKEFSGVNQLDCRNPNELWAAEIGNWRVSKITLRAGSATN